MPRYSKAKRSTVEIEGYTPLYGFPCRASEGAKAALKIVIFDSTKTTVFGANRPKPPRAKFGDSPGETSFVDKAAEINGTTVKLVAAGRPPVGPGGTKVFVDFHGLKWVWSLPPDVKTKIEPVTGYGDLGVKEYKTSAADAVYGCSSVFIDGVGLVQRPMRAAYKQGENKVSTFCTTPFTAATNWSLD